MSGKGKIHEHPNAGANGFRQNPQNINKKGAPQKHPMIHELNEILKAEGIEPLKYADLVTMYRHLLNCPESLLKEIVKNESQHPIVVVRVAANLLDYKDMASFEKIQDRAFHKATERHIVEPKEPEMTEAELRAEIKRLDTLMNDDE